MGSSSSGNVINNPQFFFQPLFPHFLSSFELPDSFMMKVNGELKSVVLMRKKLTHNQHWVVRIEQGRHFHTDDWKEFAVHHQLKVGDFLIFRHLGHFLFNVTVIDAATVCDSSFLPPKPRENTQPNEQQEEEEHEVPSRSLKRKKGRSPLPSCYFTLTSYYARHNIIYLPMKFIRDSGLIHKRCEVTVIDQKKRSWQVGLNYKKSDGRSYISKGWKTFQEANLLMPGDVIKLQTLNAGKHPVLKCSITVCDSSLPSSKPRLTSQVKQEAEENEEKEAAEEVVVEEEDPSWRRNKGRPPFSSCNFILTPYQASYSIVSLPRKFIRDSGLFCRRCEVTLIDKEKRSWKAGLNFRKGDGVSYINRGWKAFQEANLLKPGDAIKLQIIDAGKHPVFKCSCKPSQGPLPSCYFTLTSYYARCNIIYLPKKFIRECGLAVRSCEVTLIDPKKRSWQIRINYKKSDGQSYICRGWKAIQDTNLIKPGDEIKLELLNIEKHPVFKCSVTACDSSLPTSKPRENTWQKQKLQEQGHEVPSRSCNFRLSPYGARSNVINLPTKFARENRLPCKRCEVTLVDEKKRSWQVWLNYIKSSRHWYINKAFKDTNLVKSGDLVKLEILRAGKHPVLKCSVTACNSSLPSSKPQYATRVKQESEENEENEEHEAAAQVKVEEDEAPSRKRKRGRLPFPSCNLTLTHYRAHYSIEYLPMKFIRDSGLIHRRCEVTVIDHKNRTWQVGLNYKKSDGQSYISKGWKTFQEANLLKPGDVIKLQTLNAGKYPVLKCSFTACDSSLPSSKPRQTSQVKQEAEENEEEKEVVVVEESPSKRRKTGRPPFPGCNFTLTPYQASCSIVG